MQKPIAIDYYTDILCIWAWIAQRRIEELNTQFGDTIELRHYYLDVFGDTAGKMQAQWAERGFYAGFAEHVAHAVNTFETIPVNPRIWSEVRPTTSASAHLVIKAVAIVCDAKTAIDTALVLRRAFFVNAEDISQFAVLFRLIKQQGIDRHQVQKAIDDGRALAALMSDYQNAKKSSIKGSPCYVLDNGRQTLFGNVGYRVLHANIEELLKHPTGEASWC